MGFIKDAGDARRIPTQNDAASLRPHDACMLHPLVHSIAPLEAGHFEGVGQKTRRHVELLVTNLGSASAVQKEALIPELHGAFVRLRKEGFQSAAMKVYDGEISDSMVDSLKPEFDSWQRKSDSRGIFTEYSISLGKESYLEGIGSAGYNRVLKLYMNTPRRTFVRIIDAFKGNLDGINLFLKTHINTTIGDIESVGGDGNPYKIVKDLECSPSESCLCDGAERRPHRITLSSGYENLDETGVGLEHIMHRRRSRIHELFSAGVSGETPADRFLGLIFRVSENPELIIPSGKSKIYVGEVGLAGGEKTFLSIVMGVKSRRMRHIVTAYPQDGKTLRRDLARALESMPDKTRQTNAEHVNAYLSGKGLVEIPPRVG
jgi:hypothetical protein